MIHKILFIDDEQSVLKSIERLLYEESFNSIFANSPEEALDVLTKEDISVIISDMRMPNMDGVAFLQKAQEISPNSISMILSGYADINRIMQAINERHIWRFISKPWNNEDLKITIYNAIEIFEEKMAKQRLLKELEEKNLELEAFNTTLEKKVLERTELINNKNQILEIITETGDLELALTSICKKLSQYTQCNNIYIFPSFSNEIFSANNTDPDNDLLSIIDNSDYSEYALISSYYLFEIIKKNIKLGTISFDLNTELKNKKIVEIKNVVNNFYNETALSLFQLKTLKDMPNLSSKIDKLLGEI